MRITQFVLPILLVIAGNAFAESDKGNTDGQNQFIVKYRQPRAASAATADVTRTVKDVARVRRLATGAEVLRSSRTLDRAEADALMRHIAADPSVEYVQPDAIWEADVMPNDPRFGDQRALFDPKTGIHADKAWDKSMGAGVVVAVIDSGIAPHSDLTANLLPGYDFVTDPVRARDGDGRDANPRDEGNWREANACGSGAARNSAWHGTHVAGIVAALADNGKGIAGTAPHAKVVPIRVLGRCGGQLSDITDGIIWAAGGAVEGVPTNRNPAEVINLSLGGGGQCQKAEQDAIDFAVSQGATVVVSAGNEGASAANHRPANCRNVITVAAVDWTGSRVSDSNYGAVDIAAPGAQILSTFNTGRTSPVAETYAQSTGTSMATPHVSGVVALMQSRRVSQGLPPYSPAEVRAVLTDTAQALPGQCTGGCGAGLVNADAAVMHSRAVKIFEQKDASGLLTVAVFERVSSSALAQAKDFAVTLPANYVLIGGGAEGSDTNSGNMITASYPNAGLTAWMVSTKDHIRANKAYVRGWAIGLKIEGLSAKQVRDNVIVSTAISPSQSHTDATATLPSNYVRVGGGIKVNWDDVAGKWGNMATTSAPVGAHAWRVRSKDHVKVSPATAQAYVIGLRSRIAGVGTLRSTYTRNASAEASHPQATVMLDKGYALAGCGAYVQWSGAGNLLWKIRPVRSGERTGCTVSSKDLDIRSPAIVNAYSMGLRVE